MNIIRLFINRSVTTMMMVLVFVVLGFISYLRLNVDLFPDIDLPIVLITQVYEGAAPEEIEIQVVKEVEDAVSNISDIKHINSKIYENYALTIIEFNYGVDPDIKAIEVKDKVDAITMDLPEDADKPVIEKFDPFDEPILSIALFSESVPIHKIYEYADEVLKDKFSQVGGVASVEVVGGKERQINVRADLPKLMNYGISLTDVAAAIKARNLDVPAGSMNRGTFEIGVRLKGQFQTVQEIADMYLSVEKRGVFQLKDVSRVEDGFKDITSAARFNGREAVILEIFKQTDSNVVKTADGVYTVLDEIKASLPAGLQAELSWDNTDFIRESITDAISSIFLGAVLTALVLFLFLGDFRMAMVAAVVIPTSIVSSFMVMQIMGFTLNIVTLMALGVSIGALVANAIVIIENIYKHILGHDDPKEGAVRGTWEVLVAVLASAGTNIVVFVPIAFMKGVFGQVFFPFGITVVAATVFSIIASFSLTPMLSYFAMRNTKDPEKGWGIIGPKLRFFTQGVDKVRREYLNLLDVCLRWRKLTIVFTLLIFAGSIMVMRYVGGEPFPAADSSEITINAELPEDASIEASTMVMHRIEETVKTIPELKDYSSTVGGKNRGINDLRIHARLVDAHERSRGDKEISESLVEPLCTIPDLDFSVTAGRSFGNEGDMDIELYGPDYPELVKVSTMVEKIMNNTGNFQSIISSYKTPRREMRFVSDPFKSTVYGGKNAGLGGILRTAIEGDSSSLFRQGGQEYDINVALDEQYTGSINLLGAILVPLGKDKDLFPINKVGEFVPARAEASIERKDKERKITLTSYLSRLSLTENMTILKENFDSLDLKPGYRIEFAGDVELNQEVNEAVSEAFIIAAILTFMLLAAILNSFIHPFTILLTVPLGLAGVFYALFFSGITMNMLAMMSMVMLVGVVVNGAILIIDAAMSMMKGGTDPITSVKEACSEKFRPIVMSNLAIICGLLPQAFGGSGASFRVALAAPTIGGIIVSTLFTMFFIPVIFTYMERLRRFRMPRM
ncbi:MAG: efflux RND transporter permease subunit [Deltaproteobacteria bacterium]|jgi:HAE1 family hydrophobic/amphiphilic exporter-1|nr:efflux RND transporter permease subunit [Deltaproteobacteria bacterium]MDX9761340.1 efflux RND transporter permease subunit [Desulfomonilia bacterium]